MSVENIGFVRMIDNLFCISGNKGLSRLLAQLLIFVGIIAIGGCGGQVTQIRPVQNPKSTSSYDYVLGPGDVIDVFVWRNSDLSVDGIPIRPDGKISTPLVEDLTANGLTPKQLARKIEQQLAKYIKDPFVTVTVRQFVGQLNNQIRVVGEAATPQSLPYRANLTLLDVMIKVGGLTEFAAGNRASIIRTVNGKQEQIPIKIKSLLKDGDISANVPLAPGDIIIIPESWF
jgi:polysaccharide export outer membrane protein